jgi:hypothetical protein
MGLGFFYLWVQKLKEKIYKGYINMTFVAGSNMQYINVINKNLDNSFAMKDLGVAIKILCMRITRDKKNHKLTLY